MIIKYVKRVLIICLLIQLPFMQSAEFNFDGLDGFADDVAGLAHQRVAFTPSTTLYNIKDKALHRFLAVPFIIIPHQLNQEAILTLNVYNLPAA